MAEGKGAAVDVEIYESFPIHIIDIGPLPFADDHINADLIKDPYFIRADKFLVFFDDPRFEFAHFMLSLYTKDKSNRADDYINVTRYIICQENYFLPEKHDLL
ncbi:MAG: hypothetical protein V2B19_24080 [Pseudomonadota bacterium]